MSNRACDSFGSLECGDSSLLFVAEKAAMNRRTPESRAAHQFAVDGILQSADRSNRRSWLFYPSAPVLAGLVIVIAAGAWHGIRTERWQESGALEAAVARLDDLPEQVGDWQARPVEADERALRRAGAAGHWLRRFTNARTSTSVTIVLLCGRTGQMAVHRPEDCYRGAGYEMAGVPVPFPLSLAPDDAMADFWTACFRKEAASGPVQLRILWSWLGDGRWRAPESPRLAFAGIPVLYKLYAVREMAGLAESIDDDPCTDLLRLLIPELTKLLAD